MLKSSGVKFGDRSRQTYGLSLALFLSYCSKIGKVMLDLDVTETENIISVMDIFNYLLVNRGL